MVGIGNVQDIHRNSITYTNDVNKDNFQEIEQFYGLSDLYINKKFNLPVSNERIVLDTSNSKCMHNIEMKIQEIISEFTSGNKSYIANETQLVNLTCKLRFWASTQFRDVIQKLDNKQSIVRVMIDNKLSKHEKLFIEWLYDLGVTLLIITDKQNILTQVKSDNIKYMWVNTNEKIDYTSGYTKNINTNCVTKVCSVNNIEDIVPAILDKSKVVRLILDGVDSKEETYKIYKELHTKSEIDNGIKWYNPEDLVLMPEDTSIITSRIPASKVSNTDYIIATIQMFVDKSKGINSQDIKDILTAYKNTYQSSQFFNKVVKSVVTFNKLVSKDCDTIILYGKLSDSYKITLDMLLKTEGISVVVLSSFKEKTIKTDGYNIISLENSVDYFDIDRVSYVGAIKTQAASVEKEVNKQLFSGDTLGMYKHGQFKTCKTIRFSTAYPELNVWWNKEMYLRPGFESTQDSATVPTIFKVISGIDKEPKEFTKFIANLCHGKTILFDTGEHLKVCRCISTSDNNYSNIIRATDINKTSFDSQKRFFENGELMRNRIKSGVNYKYSIINDDKQELIFKSIEEIINRRLVNYESFGLNFDDYIDSVLKVGLNLSKNTIQHINWFDYFTDNPNIVIVLNDDTLLNIEDIIYIVLMSLCGFDILIFVPTRYNSVENKISDILNIDYHIIGEAYYNLDTNNLDKIRDDSSNKQSSNKSIFQKLFGKRGN